MYEIWSFLTCFCDISARYSCGPTVYDSAHIGHASSYIRQDIIRRILSSVFDIDTIMVMAVTDVEDKIIRRSQEVESCFAVLSFMKFMFLS